ncbi:hypothetical protein BpHYR1_004424 [Brachionus plicatilis]|uniref:Uncharacterized protein n=1 Tax=Brachionus plicatilis TaxID=10195 RepID=A0A3M7T465_BRAPC|nr:hypothetical protein BpHYR1_004424 [Brachionus plicatilis]
MFSRCRALEKEKIFILKQNSYFNYNFTYNWYGAADGTASFLQYLLKSLNCLKMTNVQNCEKSLHKTSRIDRRVLRKKEKHNFFQFLCIYIIIYKKQLDLNWRDKLPTGIKENQNILILIANINTMQKEFDSLGQVTRAP